MKEHVQTYTIDGQKLLAMIKKAIDNKKVITWSYDSATRGVYLGRFSEMLVTHFDASLISIRIVD